jgi:hypothetical protein
MEEAPLNGVTAIQLQYDLGPVWPDDDAVTLAVRLRLTRGDDETVDGVMAIDRDLRQVRHVTEFPLDEGVTYTLHVELLNAEINPPSPNESHLITYTTGNRFDEAPPAFSGLQELGVTEFPRAVQECCDATAEYCLGQPEPCEWCWIVDWEYVPQVNLTFRSVDDEFGAEPIAYVVYKLDGPDDTPGEPRLVLRYTRAEQQTIHLVPGDPGPWCYTIQAVDIWGRTDGNGTVLCGTIEDLMPIERREVPPEDRSNCEGPGEDTGGGDVGHDVAVDRNAGPDTGEDGPLGDTGVETPQADAPVDGECSCQTPASETSTWRWFLRR